MPLGVTRAQARADNPSETLIRNATVLTITHGTLANTDVLNSERQDRGCRKRVDRRSECSNSSMAPASLSCPHHRLPFTLDARHHHEGTLAVTSMVRTSDVLNPTDIDLYRELAGGVTT
jgi:hypothetical protein